MPILEIGVRAIELLIEPAKFFTEQVQLVACCAIGIVRRKFHHLRRQICQRRRDDRGDDAHQDERDDDRRDPVRTVVSRHLGPVLDFEQVSNDLAALPFQRNQFAEPVLRT